MLVTHLYSQEPEQLEQYRIHPPRYNPMMSSDWWKDAELSGDWGGFRNLLYDNGVSVFASYWNNIAGNPVGGMRQGTTYCDEIDFGLQLDLEKLIGWKNATITVTAANQAGSDLSGKYIGNEFTVQQLFCRSTIMFCTLYLEQKLFDDKLSLRLGRLSASADFTSSPIYALYMNGGINGTVLSVNTEFPSFLGAVWGGRARVDLTSQWNAMFGIYQTTSHIPDRTNHGLDWNIRPNDGVILIGRVGWAPEFFKRRVETPPPTRNKNVTSYSSGKKTTSAQSELKGFPGRYWLGAYWSPWTYAQFGCPEMASYSYGFYGYADQMVFQEIPGSDQGLTIWSSASFSPQENISRFPLHINGGLVYKGLIPMRDDDYTCFGFSWGKFSRDYAQMTKSAGRGYPSYELVFEWNYRIQLTKSMFVQPNIQWVINPGGTGKIPNALVLGAQMGVDF